MTSPDHVIHYAHPQTDRQTETDRQTHTHNNTQTQTYRQTDKHTQTQTVRHNYIIVTGIIMIIGFKKFFSCEQAPHNVDLLTNYHNTRYTNTTRTIVYM